MTEPAIDQSSAFEAARARLVALAYRMLGSRAEAEDVVQDVWLKWQLADTREVRTPAAWLTTITARLAIDRLRHLQRERSARAAGWMPEPWLDETAPSAEELALRSAQMSYGLMLLLERLKPDERAAFVLHEAFDCDYAEIAKILERTPAGCRQIVHRAKQRLQRDGAPLRRPEPAQHARLVEQLRTALETQDRAGLLRLFSDAAEIVSDAPLRVSEPVVAATDWVDVVMSLVANVASATQVAQTGRSGEMAQTGQRGGMAQTGQTGQMEPAASETPHASALYAECLSIDGTLGVALLQGGEIFALLDVSSRAGRLVALRIVTRAAQLQAARRRFGLPAIVRLLGAIRTPSCPAPGHTSTRTSTTVCGDFPVDVHA
ncbi:RNA polymerase sigma-70 factor, ECF subfamily [Paraburkholderia phenazinium]|uniref:RNA polymerase sigma-70 factor, ECF subfamily n=1 Tax=Paraburkholderia phenazinium TaxID=60549 RepID=A0A1G7XI90_9BURK|nr:sigma-70 family RNA polymerase sigma factor [Paraburkholderia phenazinium]SDG84005.1 RNA polymerase sigma-70 factor, ECF subfamily [Paraburkholderia phenazinium]